MQLTAPRVRLATRADTVALVAMMRLFHASEHGRRDRDGLGASLAELLADPRLGQVLIADAGAEPLGYAVVTFGFDLALGGRDAIVTELYVRPAARRRGLAALLLAEVERVAHAGGARRLRLSLLPENEPAFALYRCRGFEPRPWVVLSKDLATDSTHEAR